MDRKQLVPNEPAGGSTPGHPQPTDPEELSISRVGKRFRGSDVTGAGPSRLRDDRVPSAEPPEKSFRHFATLSEAEDFDIGAASLAQPGASTSRVSEAESHLQADTATSPFPQLPSSLFHSELQESSGSMSPLRWVSPSASPVDETAEARGGFARGLPRRSSSACGERREQVLPPAVAAQHFQSTAFLLEAGLLDKPWLPPMSRATSPGFGTWDPVPRKKLHVTSSGQGEWFSTSALQYSSALSLKTPLKWAKAGRSVSERQSQDLESFFPLKTRRLQRLRYLTPSTQTESDDWEVGSSGIALPYPHQTETSVPSTADELFQMSSSEGAREEISISSARATYHSSAMTSSESSTVECATMPNIFLINHCSSLLSNVKKHSVTLFFRAMDVAHNLRACNERMNTVHISSPDQPPGTGSSSHRRQSSDPFALIRRRESRLSRARAANEPDFFDRSHYLWALGIPRPEETESLSGSSNTQDTTSDDEELPRKKSKLQGKRSRRLVPEAALAVLIESHRKILESELPEDSRTSEDSSSSFDPLPIDYSKVVKHLKNWYHPDPYLLFLNAPTDKFLEDWQLLLQEPTLPIAELLKLVEGPTMGVLQWRKILSHSRIPLHVKKLIFPNQDAFIKWKTKILHQTSDVLLDAKRVAGVIAMNQKILFDSSINDQYFPRSRVEVEQDIEVSTYTKRVLLGFLLLRPDKRRKLHQPSKSTRKSTRVRHFKDKRDKKRQTFHQDPRKFGVTCDVSLPNVDLKRAPPGFERFILARQHYFDSKLLADQPSMRGPVTLHTFSKKMLKFDCFRHSKVPKGVEARSTYEGIPFRGETYSGYVNTEGCKDVGEENQWVEEEQKAVIEDDETRNIGLIMSTPLFHEKLGSMEWPFVDLDAILRYETRHRLPPIKVEDRRILVEDGKRWPWRLGDEEKSSIGKILIITEIRRMQRGNDPMKVYFIRGEACFLPLDGEQQQHWMRRTPRVVVLEDRFFECEDGEIQILPPEDWTPRGDLPIALCKQQIIRNPDGTIAIIPFALSDQIGLDKPTAGPSGVSLDEPTAGPSGVSSGEPTAGPSGVSSGEPTAGPSGVSSGEPTAGPSGVSSHEPTRPSTLDLPPGKICVPSRAMDSPITLQPKGFSSKGKGLKYGVGYVKRSKKE